MMKPAAWTRPAYSGLTISSGGLKEEDGILVTDGTQPPNTRYSVTLSVPGSDKPITALKFTIFPDD